MRGAGEWALHYAGMGYRVLPIVPRGKLPIVDRSLGFTRGKDDATSDPEKLARAFAAHPEANVAVLPPEDVVVLDLDSPEALTALLFFGKAFLEAPKARTGSGGAHVWLRWPEGWPKPRVRAKALPSLALDLRGFGKSYVVAPPSLHPSGGQYAWIAPLTLPKDLPTIPELLAERLLEGERPKAVSLHSPQTAPSSLEGRGGGRERAYALAELRGRCEEMASTPQGRRHDELVRHAVALWGWVRKGVLKESEVFSSLFQAALQSGLGEKEIEGVLRWVRNTSPDRTLPERR